MTSIHPFILRKSNIIRENLMMADRRRLFLVFLFQIVLAIPAAAEFRPVGDFLLTAHFKITGDKITPIPMKPIAFHVTTDGVQIRVSSADDEESYTTFEIYRSDGIGRQRSDGALEVIPGVQAKSQTDGVLRHLRLCGESMTITTFPGVSDQTVVSYSVAAEAKPATTTESPAPSPEK
ncbi:hypothetical protein JIN85_09210 [Luteolibacter pohnpeiensis]|uniref:Uncharacterized protein n=1 Tax=Luteolibacter pohnpeiensis TaxID=454153 RepID=A0A934VW97_9BACT|nr:hypothetical protein [Luteolibacter pohnpeiensis]MBK1882593.1 hypothetical protein [Luteolibacter pohnpeiensis]